MFGKRRKWKTVYKERVTASMAFFGRSREVAAFAIIQVKEKRKGGYKYRAFVNDIQGETLTNNLDIDYLLNEDPTVLNIIREYNL